VFLLFQELILIDSPEIGTVFGVYAVKIFGMDGALQIRILVEKSAF
jgi:hypothetical protein